MHIGGEHLAEVEVGAPSHRVEAEAEAGVAVQGSPLAGKLTAEDAAGAETEIGPVSEAEIVVGQGEKTTKSDLTLEILTLVTIEVINCIGGPEAEAGTDPGAQK